MNKMKTRKTTAELVKHIISSNDLRQTHLVVANDDSFNQILANDAEQEKRIADLEAEVERLKEEDFRHIEIITAQRNTIRDMKENIARTEKESTNWKIKYYALRSEILPDTRDNY
jgi:vacuolar-type H+-ATPase subunit I/STV1